MERFNKHLSGKYPILFFPSCLQGSVHFRFLKYKILSLYFAVT